MKAPRLGCQGFVVGKELCICVVAHHTILASDNPIAVSQGMHAFVESDQDKILSENFRSKNFHFGEFIEYFLGINSGPLDAIGAVWVFLEIE